MFRDMTPVGIWRDTMQFWCRAATCQMEVTLQMWKALGAPRPMPPRSADRPRAGIAPAPMAPNPRVVATLRRPDLVGRDAEKLGERLH